jgi:hypothetical protein
MHYTQDGRLLTLESPAPEGWDTFATGRADRLTPPPGESPNGTGDFFQIDFTDQQTKEMEFRFVQPIYLQNGRITFSNSWTDDDYWSFFTKIPRTEFEAGGDLNVSLVDVGGIPLWIPQTPGTGTHSFSSATAIPIPTMRSPTWFVDKSTDQVSVPTVANEANCILVAVDKIAYFIRDIKVSPRFGFDATLYKSQWISTKWTMVWRIVRVSAGVGSANGWILTYRQDTT